MQFRAIAAPLCALVVASCALPSRDVSVPIPQQAAPASVRQAHWARTSLGKFADPYGVAVNPHCASACAVYVADPGDKQVYKVQPDGSRGPIAAFGHTHFDPVGVAVFSHHQTGHDIVWVADKGTHDVTKIWEVESGSPSVCCFGTNTYNAEYPLYDRGIAVYAPRNGSQHAPFAAYAAQASHLPHTNPGQVTCRIHTSACPFVQNMQFSDPYGVAVDGNGTLYVADARDKKAYRVAGGSAVDLGKTFADPYGIAVTLDGSTVFVADAGDKNVWERNAAGTWSVVDRFADPYGVAVDASGTLYVADPGSKEVWRLTR